MAKRVKALATKPDYLNLTLQTHIVQGRNQAPQSCPLTSTHAHRHACAPLGPHINQSNQSIKKNLSKLGPLSHHCGTLVLVLAFFSHHLKTEMRSCLPEHVMLTHGKTSMDILHHYCYFFYCFCYFKTSVKMNSLTTLYFLFRMAYPDPSQFFLLGFLLCIMPLPSPLFVWKVGVRQIV